MAVKVDGLEKRVDSYVFDPEHIQVDWAENGRFTKPSPESLTDLGNSMATVGQEQPVGIRFIKREDGAKVAKLVVGYRRTEAARLWNEAHPEGPKLMVWAVDLGKGNAEDDLRKNIAENRQRKNNSAADEAYQVRKLQQVYHKTDQEVAQEFGVDVTWVKDRQLLLELSTAQLLDLHEGRMTLEAALELARLPQGKRKQVEERLANQAKREADKQEKERATADATGDFLAPNDQEPSRPAKVKPGQGHKNKKAKKAKKTTSADVKKAAREEGVQRPRQWGELKKVLEAHKSKSHIARTILAFMADEIGELELVKVIKP